jgi:hypothetical protein
MNLITTVSGYLGQMIVSISLVFVSTGVAVADDALPWQRGTYEPAWAQTEPLRTKQVVFEQDQSERANGAALANAMGELQAGDRLEIGPGRYEITSKLTMDLAGTAKAPIWIVGSDSANPPIISRPDARQNLINLGERSPCRFLCLRDLNLTGGSVVIRFYDCGNVWLDQCELHHGQHGGITVNSRDTSHMYITRNHLHHFMAGTGEAMYLGANHGKVIMRNSVIAANHVHHCGGEQGDGIELKQGSYNNWIVANHVHDTQYPCIIAYGTAGKGINVIENNTCYRASDNTMQVQGEAVVRNNLIMAAGGAGLASTDHQGKTRLLRVVHNTIITAGRGANLSSWNGREGMVFANNAVYSQRGPGLRFPGGSSRVHLSGNVVFGGVQGADRGVVAGRGLDDFVSASWNGTHRNASPSADSRILDAADEKFLTERDLNGETRMESKAAGALAR